MRAVLPLARTHDMEEAAPVGTQPLALSVVDEARARGMCLEQRGGGAVALEDQHHLVARLSAVEWPYRCSLTLYLGITIIISRPGRSVKAGERV